MNWAKGLFEGVTRRAFAAGMICSMLMMGINSYLGLKVGVIEEGYGLCILLVTLWLVLKLVKNRGLLTPHEAVVVGTMGSSGGASAFVAHFFGALVLAGRPLSVMEAVIFVGSANLLGIVLSIPVRQLFVVVEELRWPTGRVGIKLIETLQKGADSNQPRILGFFGVLAFLYLIASAGIGWFPEVSLIAAIGLSAYGVGIAWSPFLLGAGYLIGLRMGFGFLVGGFVLWAIGPYIPFDLTPPVLPTDPGFHIVRPDKWVWPGVGAVVAGGLTGLALQWRIVLKAIKSLRGMTVQGIDTDKVFSGRVTAVLLALAFLVAGAVLVFYFKVGVLYVFVGLVVVGTILVLISSRAQGDTAFNPARVMGIIIMIVFFLMGETDKSVLLLAAGLTAAAVGQAGILTQDMYIGRHFKVRSRQLFALQAIVVLPNVLMAVFVFDMLTSRYAIGTKEGLAAPISVIWYSVAKVLSGETLPPYASMAMWLGALGGIVLTLIDYYAGKRISFVAACNELRKRALAGEFAESSETTIGKLDEACVEAGLTGRCVRKLGMHSWLRHCSLMRDRPNVDEIDPPLRTMWRFSPAAFGITLGMILPIYYDVTFFVGAVVMCYVLPKVLRTDDETLNSLAAAGIVGEGIGGLVAAMLAILLL